MIWVCSDWHLGHDKLVDLGHRPADHDTRIASGLLTSVGAGDTLLHLGDVYLGRAGEEMTTRLLARIASTAKILVRGNHDSKRMPKLIGMGWHWICDSTWTTQYGKSILFTHEPVQYEPECGWNFDLNVHGHLHSVSGHRGDLIRDGRHILISAELMDYRPISLPRLVELGETPVYQDGKFIALSRYEKAL